MTPEHINKSYRSDIQGLRALAVVLVVAAHANVPGFAGGFVGVDVFFVLSGFLITGLLLQEGAATGEIRYWRFLARRLRRLLPALLFMMLLVLSTAPLLLSAYETRMQTGSLLFSATWTSNFFFAFVERDYFSALQSSDLFLHTWSLGVEEQFYVVWPALIGCAFLLTVGNTRLDLARKLLLGMLSVVFVASLMLCLYWTTEQPLLSFYMMPSRGWQFALGALVYVLFRQRLHARSGQGSQIAALLGHPGLAYLGVLLIVGSSVSIDSNVSYPSYLALIPSIGAALIIAAGTTSGYVGLSRLLSAKHVVWLGDRSYSLYLWHWPIFQFGRSYGLDSTIPGAVFLVGMSVMASAFSYKFVELPFWKGRFSRTTTLPTALVSVIAIMAVIGLSAQLGYTVYQKPKVTETINAYAPRVDIPNFYYLNPNCDSWYSSAEVVPCVYGPSDATTTVVLLGDSIGLQWYSMFATLYISSDQRVMVLTKSACPILDEEYFYNKINENYDICTSWRNSVLDYLAELKPSLVFIGSSASYDFSESQWVDGSTRVLARLAPVAGDIVIIPGTPQLTFDGPSCLEEPYRFSFRLVDSNRECEEALSSNRSMDVAGYLRRAADSFVNVDVLDLGDLVCPGKRCAASQENGLIVFRDSEHLTKSFTEAQIPTVRDRLQAIGVGQNINAATP